MEKWVELIQSFLTPQMVSTLLLLLSLALARALARRAVFRSRISSLEERRRWLVNIRNASLFLLIAGLVLIWASELRTLALSIVAITAAIVVATKEWILCLTGSGLRASAKTFVLGDRIEVNNLRGDVVDIGVMTTTLMELGPGPGLHSYTGRMIVVPNALFLSAPVFREKREQKFSHHTLRIPMKIEDDWRQAEQWLLQAAREVSADYMEEARKFFEDVEHQQGLDVPSPDPRVTLELPEPARLNLLVRFPIPTRRRGRTEQAVLRRFLELRAAGAAASEARKT